MGTKFSPSYANMFMGKLEESILRKLSCKPHTWWRFLDDIFCVWTGSIEELNEMLQYLNAFHPTIKFTMNMMENNKISFLDVEVTLEDDHSLSTDVYYKTTDTHQYLESSSCHPSHVKNSIFYSQGLRLKRIVSSEDNINIRLEELKTWMTRRGYEGPKLQKDVAIIKSKN